MIAFMLKRHGCLLFLLHGLCAISLATGAELPYAKPAEVKVSAEALDKIEPAVRALVDRGEIAGAITVVARHGKIIYSKTLGQRDRERQLPMTEETIFRIYSMSK